jgi:hypothetical protein
MNSSPDTRPRPHKMVYRGRCGTCPSFGGYRTAELPADSAASGHRLAIKGKSRFSLIQDRIQERSDSFSVLQVSSEHLNDRIVPVHIVLHPLHTGAHQGCQIYLINHADTASPHDHRMFIHHIIPFGRTYDHNSFFCTEKEIRGTDHISYIFDEQYIDGIEGKVFQSMLHQMRIQMTFLAGVHVHRWNTECDDALIIIIPVDVPCDSASSQAFLAEQRDQPLDESSFSRSNRTQEIEGPDPMRAEEIRIRLRDPVVGGVDVFFELDVHMVHSRYWLDVNLHIRITPIGMR